MNIIRHISPDNRFLYNIKYHDDHSLDTISIHMLQTDNVWSPSIPFCAFPPEQVEEIQYMCCELIERVVS